MEGSKDDVVGVTVEKYDHVSVVADVDFWFESADAFLNFVRRIVVFVGFLLRFLWLFLAST